MIEPNNNNCRSGE